MDTQQLIESFIDSIAPSSSFVTYIKNEDGTCSKVTYIVQKNVEVFNVDSVEANIINIQSALDEQQKIKSLF